MIRTNWRYLCHKGDGAVVQNISGGNCEIINSVFAYFLLMSASWATYTMLANNILAFRYVNVLVMVLLAVLLLLSAWFVIKNQAKRQLWFCFLSAYWRVQEFCLLVNSC